MATIRAYTTIEQSKKLAEILPLESADMHYKVNRHNNESKIFMIPYSELGYYKDNDYQYTVCAWSLAALMKLLPSKFTERGRYSETTYKIDIRKYALTDDVDVYQIAYGSIKFDVDGHDSFKDMINTGQKEDLLDAAFQMICWLKENNLI